MAKKKTHRKKTRRVRHGAPIRLAKAAIAYGAPRAKKHLTKENLKKAIAASKAATSKLKALLHKKKKNGSQRITMSIFRE